MLLYLPNHCKNERLNRTWSKPIALYPNWKSKKRTKHFVSEMDQQLDVVLTVGRCLPVLTCRTHKDEHQAHVKRNKETHQDKEDERGHLPSCWENARDTVIKGKKEQGQGIGKTRLKGKQGEGRNKHSRGGTCANIKKQELEQRCTGSFDKESSWKDA